MTTPRISANDLRFAGEGADSLRNQPTFLVVAGDGKPEVVTAADLRGRPALLQIDTENRGPGMRANVGLKIILDGKPYDKPIENFDKVDAVFLTQSAVGKFLLPYYMRFKSAAEVQALENRLFNSPEVIAAFHIPGSFTFPIWRLGLICRKSPEELVFEMFTHADLDDAPNGAGPSSAPRGKAPAKHPVKR